MRTEEPNTYEEVVNSLFKNDHELIKILNSNLTSIEKRTLLEAMKSSRLRDIFYTIRYFSSEDFMYSISR